MNDKPTFTRLRDGRVLVDRFPPTVAITRELLEDADPALLERSGRTVTFRCANATASYRLHRRGPFPRCYTCLRLALS